MRKLLVFLLALGALLYLGSTYFRREKAAPAEATTKDAAPTDTAPSVPKARLDNVREKARNIEQEDERRNKEMLDKTEGK